MDSDVVSSTKEHGLFVAGLVHYVAPQAKIQLVKILNDEGLGDLYTLIAELNKLLEADKGPDLDLDKVVINLSLGFDPLPLINGVPDYSKAAETADDDEVKLLRTMLRAVHNAGAVIVAAAGNNTSQADADAIPFLAPVTFPLHSVPRLISAIPARWSEVALDVAAHTSGGRVSCFSNVVEMETSTAGLSPSLLAPGGDGYHITYQIPYYGYEVSPGEPILQDVCQSSRRFVTNEQNPDRRLFCTDPGYSCPAVLTSVTTQGYAQWLGTSFATSIASGVVALIRGACPTASPADIQTFLYERFTNAPQNAGVFPAQGHLDVDQIMDNSTDTVFWTSYCTADK